MVRVGVFKKFVVGLVPFILRKGKQFLCLLYAMVGVAREEVVAGEALTAELLEKGKRKGQVQVVRELLAEMSSDIVLLDGSDGNVVLFGSNEPYVQRCGINSSVVRILPMEQTTVGVDFYVKTSAEHVERVEMLLRDVVFAGVGYEIVAG